MKTINLFPLAKPNPKFREQLELKVLQVYNQRSRPYINWRWLVAPGVILASLLLAVLVGKGYLFSQLPSIRQPGQLAEKPQKIDQLDQELAELSEALNTDADLEAAIAFSNL